MAIDLVIHRGDTKPWVIKLKQTATGSGGFAPVDLTTAVSVKYYARLVNATSNKIDGKLCSVALATAGKIQLTPATGDVDTAGTYKAYSKVTWSDGTISRFPTRDLGGDKFDTVLITGNYE